MAAVCGSVSVPLSDKQHREIEKRRSKAKEKLTRNRQARCCLCCHGGKYVRCSCVLSGKNCHNCLPSRSNSYSNTSPASNGHSLSEASLDSPNSLFVPSDTRLPLPAVDGGHFDPTTTWPPSPRIYLSSDLFSLLEECYLLSPPLRTSTLLLSSLMTRLCVGGVISSSFPSAIQPTYLFRNWRSCLMLMQVILLLRTMLSKQPCFFQLSFFKNLF